MADDTTDLIQLTADIVAAQVANNSVPASELPLLIQSVFAALSNAQAPAVPAAAPQEPAVPVRSSVKHDYIVCLEDGAKLKMLKRYLRTRYEMTPEEYRAKWNLPRDYPMVAPAYAEQRRGLANAIGLGRKKTPEVAEIIEPAPEPKKAAASRATKPKTTIADTAETAAAPKKRGRTPKVAAEPTEISPVDAEG